MYNVHYLFDIIENYSVIFFDWALRTFFCTFVLVLFCLVLLLLFPIFDKHDKFILVQFVSGMAKFVNLTHQRIWELQLNFFCQVGLWAYLEEIFWIAIRSIEPRQK